MKMHVLTVLIATGITFFSACEEPLTGERSDNIAPETRLFLDTVNTVTTALVDLYWDGDDPDGSVLGFIYSVDSGKTWTFTDKRNASVVIPTNGKSLALSRVFVSAVDDQGNGSHDQSVFFNQANIGPEPFTDTDSSGTFTAGEPFFDFGKIDPTPASVLFSIRNSLPVAQFNILAKLPETTLPIVTILLNPSDPDGNNTIIKAELALNDTSAAAWIDIPIDQKILTLSSDSRDTLSTNTTFNILLGTQLTPSGLKLPGLKLNNLNRLYYRVTDNTGSKSQITNLPDSSENWYVKKFSSAGEILLIRDHSNGDADKWKAILSKTPGKNSGTFYNNLDILELKKPNGEVVLSPGTGIVQLKATLNSYRKVIWYGANNTSLEYAQQLVPGYLSKPNIFGKSGKILFRTGFDRNAGTTEIPMGFLPIDSLNFSFYYPDGKKGNGFISSIVTNGGIRKDSFDSNFPTPKPDLSFFNSLPDSLLYSGFGSSVLNSYFTFVPNTNAYILYRLNFPRKSFGENWPVTPTRYFGFGTPAVMIENLDRNLVFTTIPLIYLDQTTPGYPKNGYDNPLIHFLALILNEEFERP
ncbi:MAG: hypothetical protein J0L62_15080 [Bacteroidetes bacterium]|nr:hypothetical protein [Bacteroidota bacterium]